MNEVITCSLCPRLCRIQEGERGFCQTRENVEGHLFPLAYGRLTDLSICPVRMLPFSRYLTEATVLAVGSFGSNEEADTKEQNSIHLMPDELVELACEQKENGVSGIAYVFSEPILNWEYVRDMSRIAHTKGLKVLLVTNALTQTDLLYRMLYAVDAACVRLASGIYQAFDADTKNLFLNNIELIGKHAFLEACYESSGYEAQEKSEVEELSAFAEALSWISLQIPLAIRYRDGAPAGQNEDQAARLSACAKAYLRNVHT